MRAPERIDALDVCDRSVPNAWKVHSIYRYNLAKRYCRNKVVLDVGCGTGYGAYMLSEVAKRVVALDVANCFKRRYKTHNVKFVRSSAEKMPFVNAFDVVICLEVIEHVKKPEKLLQQIQGALKNGGHLVLSTPNRKYSSKDSTVRPFHLREFYLSELLEMVRQHDFRVVKVIGQNLSRWHGVLTGPLRRHPRQPCRQNIKETYKPSTRISPHFVLLNCKLGHFLPQYSITIIVVARKAKKLERNEDA